MLYKVHFFIIFHNGVKCKFIIFPSSSSFFFFGSFFIAVLYQNAALLMEVIGFILLFDFVKLGLNNILSTFIYRIKSLEILFRLFFQEGGIEISHFKKKSLFVLCNYFKILLITTA